MEWKTVKTESKISYCYGFNWVTDDRLHIDPKTTVQV